jgi:hypothetical protein
MVYPPFTHSNFPVSFFFFFLFLSRLQSRRMALRPGLPLGPAPVSLAGVIAAGLAPIRPGSGVCWHGTGEFILRPFFSVGTKLAIFVCALFLLFFWFPAWVGTELAIFSRGVFFPFLVLVSVRCKTVSTPYHPLKFRGTAHYAKNSKTAII